MNIDEIDKLIIDISVGRKNALKDLYSKTREIVYGFAFSILKDYALAEDITHDVYVKIVSSSGNYKACGKGLAWILRITRNLAYNVIKSRKRFTSLNHDTAGTTQINNAEDKIIIEKALLALNIKQREIVILHAISGYSHKEISSLLNMTYPTVRWHYYRAMKALKESIETGVYNEIKK